MNLVTHSGRMRGQRRALASGQRMPCGVNMDVTQDESGNDKEIASEVNESLGTNTESINEDSEPQESEGHEGRGDPLYIQKRLKKQKRAHDREIRELQSRIDQMQSQYQPTQNLQQQQGPNDFGNQDAGNVNGMIQQEVGYALQQQELEKRRATEAEAQQHIAKQYQELNRHLDTTSDKYDDFDDIVRGNLPYTTAMRDISLTLPKKGPGSAGEVLYRLGKNPEE